MRKHGHHRSGPAGLTAAIYAARANSAAASDRRQGPGGQLTLTTLVKTIRVQRRDHGAATHGRDAKQAQRFGSEIVTSYVHALKLNDIRFVCITATRNSGKNDCRFDRFVAKLMGIETELQLMGHGVSTCATCDGFFYRARKSLSVGGAIPPWKRRTFLTKFGDKSFPSSIAGHASSLE